MHRRSPLTPLALALAVITLVACGNGEPAASSQASTPESSATTEPTSEQPPPSSSATPSPSPSPSTTTPPAKGRVVVLDPGHNGGNGKNPGVINKPVPAGRGKGKPCNTTGTATNAGYPEHAFTWDVAGRIRALLVAKGVRVELTRPNDTGVGPCVNERAEIGNRANADAVVSIHSDGSTTAGHRGFHVIYSNPPLNTAQGAPSTRLAGLVRDAMRDGGIPLSNYIGKAGLNGRDDIAGLNLSTRPAIMVECANMRDAGEAALAASPEGRQKYAAAIADGILRYLG
ncbi:N-acetylmuramoyl-L-alanine amidase [Crossiella equi]|uniref:N-acetylmuramoyl-L-alanine amidase n=1 Tax=Crossiella equi TaxID=130796 RepID=A0ABS5AG59_9PSEU|nr:N-acetylmuramoyl-L-alanine amidase [Crossiella equi]MBP2475326.1 N-acetylmuramoyl-L-alanine amidase [Crossiella equi]